MKRALFLLIFGLFLFSGVSFARDDIDLSCYTHEQRQSIDSGSENILIETKTQDFIIRQGGEYLSPKDVGELYKYIPFTKNITSSSLDTKDNKTIELTIDNLSTNNYEIHFQHDAKYHTPKYYISEDGKEYSQVTARNISDFRIYKVRIVFESNQSEEIREIINIKNLTIERKNYISSLQLSSREDIHFYFYNICNKRKIQLAKSSNIIKGAEIYDILSPTKHYLYTQKTTDSDGDRIMDLYDNCLLVKNSDQKDINQNKIGDACEFDSDNDSIPDEIDNCRNIANSTQEDDDRDTIGNACDNSEYYNPDQRDINNNGIGDITEQKEKHLAENDTDKDGVINFSDNCKSISNPDQADDDRDGIGNSCDNCKTFQNRDQTDENKNGIGDICEDSDNDGVDSITDNCINTPNPDQADDDNDGIGNVCEDDDRDEVIFSVDNCPYHYNRDQLDTDSDGLGDICDEDDNRFLESNKPIFILLMLLVIAGFIGAIFMMARKLQK